VCTLKGTTYQSRGKDEILDTGDRRLSLLFQETEVPSERERDALIRENLTLGKSDRV